MSENENEKKYEIHKNKLWVAWDGSWGRSDILITDDEQWTREQQITFDKLSLSRDPEIEDVVEILTDTKEETMSNNEPEKKYEIHKNKLWVAWDGSWGRSDILITDDEQWTREQQIAFGLLSLDRDPEIEDVVEILTDTKEETMSNNEQEHPDIDIAFICTDEVLAWKRPIRLRFKSNEAQVSLYWDEQDGYSAIVKTFFEGWSEDEQAEFLRWTRDQENLGILDDLTAWKRPNTEEED